MRTKLKTRTSLPLARSRNAVGVLFVLPVVTYLAIFLAYPFLLGLWLSFTDAFIGRPGIFIAFENYYLLLTDTVFQMVVFNSALYTVVAVAGKLVLGLALALLLNREFRGKGLVRAIVLLPWIVPSALSALVFWWMYDTQFGIFNWILQWVGLIGENINWLGEPNLARGSLIFANIWRGIPFFAIALLAGLQTISPSLYEASALDGATGWQQFRYVTFPLLLPLTVVTTVFSTIWTIGDFQLPWVITRGGPANATHLFGTLAYQRAIQGGQLGEGAAIASFVFPVLLVSVTLALISLRQERS